MQATKQEKRIRRHARARARIKGTPDVPRVSVFRSNQHLFVQIIDDVNGKTLASASDIVKKGKQVKTSTKSERAAHVAELLAEKAKQAGISKVVFDRGGFKFHGRVKAFAENLRKQGLQF